MPTIDGVQEWGLEEGKCGTVGGYYLKEGV